MPRACPPSTDRPGSVTLLLGPPDEAVYAPARLPAAWRAARWLDLGAALLDRLDAGDSLVAAEHEAWSQRREPGGKALLDAARTTSRTELARAYERLLDDLAEVRELVVVEPQLALAAHLDLARLAQGRARLLWWVPGELRAGEPRLYGRLVPPLALTAGVLREWRDDA